MEAIEMSIDRRKDKKLWCIYTLEYYSAIKEECVWVSSNEVDKPKAYYTERSKKEKDNFHMLTHIYGL